MSKKNFPIFNWDEKSGIATCILSDNENTFIGVASCCNEDSDMKNEKTGCSIALYRAEIKYYKHLKNHVIVPQLSSLEHLYSTMYRSKKFNPNSYENKMLQRQIQYHKNNLNTVNQILSERKKELNSYIKEKEKFYQKIRKNRKGQE